MLGTGAYIVAKTYNAFDYVQKVFEPVTDLYNKTNNPVIINPPAGKSPLDVNPATGNTYAQDNINQGNKDLREAIEDIGVIGGATQEQITPGPEDLLKPIGKFIGKSCPLK